MDQLGDQFQAHLACQAVDLGDTGFKRDCAIARFKNDPVVIASLNATMRAQRDREVHSGSARVKEIKRPDVDGTAGKVNSSWGRRFNNHFLKWTLVLGLWSL